jgi:hypothetical protein
MSLNFGHGRAYCSSPRRYMSLEYYDGMILTGEKPNNSEKRLVSVSLRPPQIPHGLTRAQILSSW